MDFFIKSNESVDLKITHDLELFRFTFTVGVVGGQMISYLKKENWKNFS